MGDRERDRGDRASDLLGNDEFYRALAAQPRRRTLAYLIDEGSCTVDELVEVLRDWEGTTERGVPSERHEKIRLELLHAHLPCLAATGLVAYDRTDETVRLREIEDEAREILSLVTERESD